MSGWLDLWWWIENQPSSRLFGSMAIELGVSAIDMHYLAMAWIQGDRLGFRARYMALKPYKRYSIISTNRIVKPKN